MNIKTAKKRKKLSPDQKKLIWSTVKENAGAGWTTGDVHTHDPTKADIVKEFDDSKFR